MTRTELIELIDQNIRKNDNEEITGPVMNQVLKTILENLPLKGESGLAVYDPAMSYTQGATCVYGKQIYMCYSATTGTWNPNHWKVISAGLAVGSIAERDALVNRFEGMIVTVNGDAGTERYQLQGGLTNSHWRFVGDQEWRKVQLNVREPGQRYFEVAKGIGDSQLWLNNIMVDEYQIDEGMLEWLSSIELELDDELIFKYKLK